MTKTNQKLKNLPISTILWSTLIFSSAAYCATIGMITFDVVGRKSLNQESQKIAAMVAKQEEAFSEKTKLLAVSPNSVKHSNSIVYIDSSSVASVGLAR